MDGDDNETVASLLRELSPPSNEEAFPQAPPHSVRHALAKLHAWALLHPQSPVTHLSSVGSSLSDIDLPSPIALHPNLHSANTAVVLAALPKAPSVSTILHVHPPTHAPVFPAHTPPTVTTVTVSLASHTAAATTLSAALRDAVAQRTPVALLVIHLHGRDSLVPALPVAHALCTRFGARLHLSGPGCLAAAFGDSNFLTGITLDLAQACDVVACGVLTFGVDTSPKYGTEIFPQAICMCNFLKAFPVSAMKRVLDDVSDIAAAVVDAAYRIVDLWEAELLSPGEARLRCVTDITIHPAVVDADSSQLLALHGEELSISSTAVLRRRCSSSLSAVPAICDTLIRVVRASELAKVARAAFITRIRQCEDAEVHPESGTKLCAITVAPFGHVPPAGRWRGDREARALVAACTDEFVREAASMDELQIQLNADTLAAVISPRLEGSIAADAADLALECERVSRAWAVNEEKARMWGVQVAESVAGAVLRVVARIGVGDGVVMKAARDNGEDQVAIKEGNRPELQVPTDSEGQDDVNSLEDELTKQMENARNDHQLPPLNGDATDTAEVNSERDTRYQSNSAEAKADDQEEQPQRQGKGPGIWGLLFGGNNADPREASESSDEAESNELEDYYFRP